MERSYINRLHSDSNRATETAGLLPAGLAWENKALSHHDSGCLPVEYICPVTGMEFILVEGGKYLMGNAVGSGCADESPAHEVEIQDFYLGKYPVTQLQWLRVMGYNPSNCGTSEQCPVDSISYDMAIEFITNMNLFFKDYGLLFRLPTEAEWEYAARGGVEGNYVPADF